MNVEKILIKNRSSAWVDVVSIDLILVTVNSMAGQFRGFGQSRSCHRHVKVMLRSCQGNDEVISRYFWI